MAQVNVLEAKTDLSKLIRLLERGEEDRIVIARRNRPVAQLTLIAKPDVANRIGAARGELLYSSGWDSAEVNEEAASLFRASESGAL